jgi:type II pantothenate kinase
MMMSPFVLLADPASYVACEWDFTTHHEARAYWIPLLIRNFETTLKLAEEVERSRGRAGPDIADRISRCREALRAHMHAYDRDPAPHGRVTIVTLDRWRDRILRAHDLIDPYELLKQRENEKTLPLLPGLCAQLDALPAAELPRALIEGVFAGNIFDMGAEATAKAFLSQSPDFFAVRKKLSPRPWLIDDFDALERDLLRHFRAGLFRKVVFFVDNAGSDFLLGAIPLMRALAKSGSRIVLVANERPTLNDMTIAEVRQWWPRIVSAVPDLATLPFDLVSSGTGEPLIDLLEVSDELNVAAAGADLVVIEGMGRGVESNLDARFVCPALNLAMIKDLSIARRHGGKLYDCVCRYR